MLQYDFSPSPVTGIIYTLPQTATTVNNATLSGVNGQCLDANANRKRFFIQNLSSGTAYVALGSVASRTNYNVILNADNLGGGNPSGLGGTFSDSNWKGTVSHSGAFPGYMVWEEV